MVQRQKPSSSRTVRLSYSLTRPIQRAQTSLLIVSYVELGFEPKTLQRWQRVLIHDHSDMDAAQNNAQKAYKINKTEQ
ncbi:hypothetical protein TNCV_3933521 [Trichonephila clavipes]|nr:hypothetical protein TNCV_3933521 [Trichonephila clavipes]